jgi:two-component system phosphate regulon sensor histidine kinase PhoR
MAQQAHRMQTLVNDLLTLSRLEGSPPPRMDEWVDMRVCCSSVNRRRVNSPC